MVQNVWQGKAAWNKIAVTFANVDKPNSKYNVFMLWLYQGSDSDSVYNLTTVLASLVPEIENLLSMKLKFLISDGSVMGLKCTFFEFPFWVT